MRKRGVNFLVWIVAGIIIGSVLLYNFGGDGLEKSPRVSTKIESAPFLETYSFSSSEVVYPAFSHVVSSIKYLVNFDESDVLESTLFINGVEVDSSPEFVGSRGEILDTAVDFRYDSFNHGYNLKYGVQIAQIYANLSDWGHQGASAGYLPNWWNGLINPGVTLGVYNLSRYDISGADTSDGSLALNASDAGTGTCAGQDQDSNVKVGYDDGQEHRFYGGGNTTNTVNGQGADGGSSPMWLFIN